MTSWYSVSVTVPPDAAEAIEYAFNSLDALGTEINHLRKKNLDSVTVIGYFNELPDEDRVQDELHYALRVYDLNSESIHQLERNLVEEIDWLAEWKKHWRPTTVGNFVIAPPWSEFEETGKIVIRIDPNMAFGTGTHETTQLCLRAIEKYYLPGDSFLDVGTGTGILAIAAAKLNSESKISNSRLFAVDVDEPSVKLAAENAELNGVGEMIDFRVGSIEPSTHPHHFVCANLTLDVIEPLLPVLVDKAEKTLLLSGILAEQRSLIVASLTMLWIDRLETEQEGEWMSVVVQK